MARTARRADEPLVLLDDREHEKLRARRGRGSRAWPALNTCGPSNLFNCNQKTTEARPSAKLREWRPPAVVRPGRVSTAPCKSRRLRQLVGKLLKEFLPVLAPSRPWRGPSRGRAPGRRPPRTAI